MQSISLDKVIPEPLQGNILNPDSIWGKETTFTSGGAYLVCAPSGTGKTTLISCLYGLRSDYSGNILLNSENARAFTPDRWSALRKNVFALVFQDLRLFSQLSVMENILLKSTLTPVKSLAEIRTMADRLGILNQLEKPCGKLSLGQQQRVAIIRALTQPFRYIFLDEPFSHLDETNIRLASDLIIEECRKNDAALLITSLGDNNYFNYTSKISV